MYFNLSILKIQAQQNNKHLEDELSKTAVMLDKTFVQTKPGVDMQKSENARLVSRLAKAEIENERLEEVCLLTLFRSIYIIATLSIVICLKRKNKHRSYIIILMILSCFEFLFVL